MLIQNAPQVEAEMHNLRADLKLEKESTKSLLMQLKRKNEELEKLKRQSMDDQ